MLYVTANLLIKLEINMNAFERLQVVSDPTGPASGGTPPLILQVLLVRFRPPGNRNSYHLSFKATDKGKYYGSR